MAERRSSPWRLPVALVSLTGLSWAVYQSAPPRIAELAIVPYTACLIFGAGLAYPAARRAGAGTAGALLAGLAIPTLWLGKEMVRVTAVFPAGQALYYALNPLSVGIFVAAWSQMAVAELCLQRRSGARAGWPVAVLLGVAALAAAAWVVGHDSGGRDLFYGYIAGYRRLFPGP